MKLIFLTIVIAGGLTACSDGTRDKDHGSTDSLNHPLTTDTAINPGVLNPTDSATIIPDTARRDRTEVRKPSDTLKRNDSTR